MLDIAPIAEIKINMGEKGDKKVITKDHRGKPWQFAVLQLEDLNVKYV